MATTHPNKQTGATQCDSILAALQAANGQEVGLFDLYLASGSLAVATRVSNLRLDGHNIECRTERKQRQIHSYYRLIIAE